MAEDYYKTLGVTREASADEIRKAYKKLVRKYHPDMNPDDASAADRFKQVQEAFDVLGDTERREQYDRYGTAFKPGMGPKPGHTYTWKDMGSGQGGFSGDLDLGDLFGGQIDLGDLFGGGGSPFGRGGGGQRRARPVRGQDHRLEIDVPFQVAAEGGEHRLELQRDGKPELLTIKIPAGVDTGSVIRLAGEGNPGVNGGEPGNLLVTIRVGRHPYFRREGNDISVEVPITVSEAVLGAKVEVPTLSEGTVMLTVPPGSSSGTKLRLRGKGIPDRKTKQRGDQLVRIKIVVPSKLDSRGDQLMRQFADHEQSNPRENLW